MTIETAMPKTATTMRTDTQEQKSGDAPPHTRRAQLVKLSIYAVDIAGIVAILAVGVWLLFRSSPQLLSIAAVAVLVAVGIGLYPVSYRRGQSTIGIRIFLIVFLLLLAISTPLMPELMLAMILAYVIFFVRGNLLVGEKNPHWLTGACLFAFIANVLLVRNADLKWSPVPNETVRLIVGASFGSLALLAVAIVVRMAALGQEEQSHLALETKKRVAVEREQCAYVRATVKKYVAYMDEVAEGNLAARLSLDKDKQRMDDPLVALGHQLNEMVDGFQYTVAQIEGQREGLRATVDRYVAHMAEVACDNSLVVPIMADGQFCGIAGVDLDLEHLQELANPVHIYDGAGKLVLVSNDGVLASTSQRKGIAR
ncbi:MAG: hypothetical protein GY832_05475 [Chloroflexi bacterium]|nr:hypothetical protein [Chloroflexota bacterium]